MFECVAYVLKTFANYRLVTSLISHRYCIAGSSNTFAFHSQCSLPCFFCTLQENLGKSVECPDLIGARIPVCRTFILFISRITVAHAQYAYRTVNCQLQRYTSCRSEVLSLILKLHIDDRYVPVINLYRIAVCGQDNAFRFSCGTYCLHQLAFPVLVSDCFYRSGTINCFP